MAVVRQVGRWLTVALAAVVFAGCSPRVGEQDALEFSYPPIRRAHAKLREGDRQAALDLINKALDEKPKMAQAHLEAAQLYDEYLHNYTRAVYHYERYLELRPQTEKREMIEGFVRKAKIAWAASLADQIPGFDKKTQALQEENDRLKQDLRLVRANLSQRLAEPAAPKSAPKPESEQLSVAQETPGAEPVVGDGAGAQPPPAGKPSVKLSGRQYQVQRGDTLSRIAARMYRNPRKWKLIYDANQNVLHGAQKVQAGQVLSIP